MQGISTIFTEQMPIYLVFEKQILCCHQNFQQLTTQYDNPQEWQGKIKSSLH